MKPLILAIETSCDETAAAVTCGREVLGQSVSSQIAIHVPYGGVVPEIASRKHMEALIPVTEEALCRAGVSLSQIDRIAVTYGPGLVGALLCGLCYAKGLALGHKLPLMGVHHIEGHISANYIAHPWLEPPFACLVVSGGHSHLVEVPEYGRYRLLARTRDDAAGEAFDKAARMLNLPYPGGPHLDKLSQGGNDSALALKRPDAGGDFSFSGLKSGLIQAVARMERLGESLPPADIAASFQKAVVDELLDIALPKVAQLGHKTLALAGGVACNSLLRKESLRRGEEMGIKVCYPPPDLCTDNAAMIGCAAYYAKDPGDGLSLNAVPSLPLNE